MREFWVELTSFQQVQDFVSIAAAQSFDIRAGNEWQQINGKDLMGMFSLDYSRPVRVRMDCTQEAFETFRDAAGQFLVK